MNKGDLRKNFGAIFPQKERLPSDFIDRVIPFLQGNVLSFIPLKNECDISSLNNFLWKEGRLLLPKIVKDQLEVCKVIELEPFKRSAWGTLTCHKGIPKTAVDVHTVIVPCLGVDLSFNRLGRGKGCYDRFLKSLDARIVRVCIVYKEQLSLALPTDPWDEKVDKIFVF